MPYETTTKARESVMRIEDIERPEPNDDALYEAQHFEHLQGELYWEVKELQRVWGQLRLVRDVPDFYLKLQNDMHLQIQRVRYIKYQLGKVESCR